MAENKFDIHQLFDDLSPELQEKARVCKTKEDLLKLAAEEDIEIPMEALESVAGGCWTSLETCPMGGQHTWEAISSFGLKCKKCGREETVFF